MRGAPALLIACACFEEPSYEGRRCFSNEPCPNELVCVNERCQRSIDAGIEDGGAADASVDPARCATAVSYPTSGWEARYYLLPRDPAIEEANCFGVENLDGVELHKDFMFEGPTPEILTFASRYTGTRELAGALALTIFHDDGFRMFANDTSIYDHWEGPIRGAVTVEHYFARAQYRLRIDHYDLAGEADIQVGWRAVCAPAPPPESGWALSFHRLDQSGAIDEDDCFGLANARTSTLGLSYSEAPGKVRDAGVNDNYAIVARARRTFNGATTFMIGHDDGLRLYVGNALIYDDLTSGPPRTETATATLNGAQELRLEAYDFTGSVDVQLTW